MTRLALLVLTGAAAAALGLGLGVGGFGGVALPTGDMADQDHGDMKASPKFGGKVLLDITPMFEVEAAVGYHTGHHLKDWEDTTGIEEPSTKVVPITAGMNVKYVVGPLGVYAGGGFGYYLATIGSTGVLAIPLVGNVAYSADTNVNGLGFYGSGGVLVRFGKLAVDINPRYNYVVNDGTYDYTLKWDWNGIGGTEHGTYEKDWKDSYVDVLFGVDYFFM